MRTAAYWDRGVENVPFMTGAASVMRCEDLMAPLSMVAAFPLIGVLDVGCGTGRLSRLCLRYVGVDISKDAVEYARTHHGVEAHLITGPTGLAALEDDLAGRVRLITCLSVFTHIGPHERRHYLAVFADLAHELIVDVIPGDGSGDVALWTARLDEFEGDLAAAGWSVQDTLERTSPDGVRHRYYYAKLDAPAPCRLGEVVECVNQWAKR